ncbi:hypothetical protein BH23ACT11_BH23ACT11_22770 [soil metagenome]
MTAAIMPSLVPLTLYLSISPAQPLTLYTRATLGETKRRRSVRNAAR